MILRIQIAVVGSYLLLHGFGFLVLESSYQEFQGLKLVKLC